MLIDTHTHIYGHEFDEDRDEVVKRAIEAGVSHLILPAVNEESVQRMRQMKHNYPELCSMAVGLHPEDVRNNYEEQLKFVETELKTGDYIAVGEIGIDLYWDKTYQDEQEKAFLQQVQWALDYKLPLIIHTRDSLNRTLQLLNTYKQYNLKGIFHCFGGELDDAKAIFEMGDFKLGIGGILTFKNANLSQTLKHIPLEKIVIETDAPYLAPVPKRGKRNEPAFLTHLIPYLTNIYQCDENTLCDTLRENTKKVFFAE